MYICLLAIFGTAVSIVLFNYLIKISGALFSTSVTYLIPIVAVFWGLLDGEVLGIGLIAGMLLILLGVYLISKKKPVSSKRNIFFILGNIITNFIHCLKMKKINNKE